MFQFTRPQEARLAKSVRRFIDTQFQFTRPQEARLHGRATRSTIREFQFTRPQEARLQAKGRKRHARQFQFTRPQEARRNWHTHQYRQYCFNSRARKRRDGSCARRPSVRARFNSRARKRRDRRPPTQILEDLFQFTRPQEARRKAEEEAKTR